jgi:histidyl-tRNA synthetase
LNCGGIKNYFKKEKKMSETEIKKIVEVLKVLGYSNLDVELNSDYYIISFSKPITEQHENIIRAMTEGNLIGFYYNLLGKQFIHIRVSKDRIDKLEELIDRRIDRRIAELRNEEITNSAKINQTDDEDFLRIFHTVEEVWSEV